MSLPFQPPSRFIMKERCIIKKRKKKHVNLLTRSFQSFSKNFNKYARCQYRKERYSFPSLYHIRARCLLIACQKSKNNCSTPYALTRAYSCKQTLFLAGEQFQNINLARKWYLFLRRVTMNVLFVDRIFNPTFLKANNYLLLILQR